MKLEEFEDEQPENFRDKVKKKYVKWKKERKKLNREKTKYKKDYQEIYNS